MIFSLYFNDPFAIVQGIIVSISRIMIMGQVFELRYRFLLIALCLIVIFLLLYVYYLFNYILKNKQKIKNKLFLALESILKECVSIYIY